MFSFLERKVLGIATEGESLNRIIRQTQGAIKWMANIQALRPLPPEGIIIGEEDVQPITTGIPHHLVGPFGHWNLGAGKEG